MKSTLFFPLIALLSMAGNVQAAPGPSKENGKPCMANNQCHSGICKKSSGKCQPKPFTTDADCRNGIKCAIAQYFSRQN